MHRPDHNEYQDRHPVSGENGAAQRVLLLVLLLVVVLFGYLYFFTGVVKPRQDVSPPPVAPVARKPIPPRPGADQASDTVAKTPEKAEKADVATPVAGTKKAPPVAKQNPVPAESDNLPPKKERPASNPPVAKKSPAPAVKASPKVTPEQKEKVKQAPLPEKKVKQAELPKAEKVPQKPAVAKPAARYALSAGEFVLEENLKRTQRQLKKLGIGEFRISTQLKSEPMHRVHIGDFSTRAEAAAELKKMQTATGSAFILPAGEKFSLYAGSFFNAGQAAQEKARLSAIASNVTVQEVKVPVRVKRLMAGAYTDKASAAAAAERVKKAGIATSIVPLQKASK